MLLMIDNYDSFTYNLVQYFGELGEETLVYRNDKISISEIEALSPERIIISPGPCTPNEAGISLELVEFVLVTRVLARHLAEELSMQRKSCTAKPLKFIIIIVMFLLVWVIRSLRRVIIHW